MRHIRQKRGLDCGIAVAAMLAKTDYDTAYIATSYQSVIRGLYVNDMLACLIKMNCPLWKASKSGYKNLLIEYQGIPKEGHALIIRRPTDTFGHWIARHKEMIFDPEFPKPCRIESYSRKTWEIVRLIVRAT